MEAPCRGCQARRIGYHAVCERHIKFDAEETRCGNGNAAEHAPDGRRADICKAAKRKQRKFTRRHKK